MMTVYDALRACQPLMLVNLFDFAPVRTCEIVRPSTVLYTTPLERYYYVSTFSAAQHRSGRDMLEKNDA